jgi:outer membrane immunogenic protein
MKKFLLGATAFVALFSGSAMAADLPVKAPVMKAPPPPAAFSWNGCFIGVAGGGVWGRSRHDGFPPGPTELTPFFDVSGGLAGVEYGCNYQFSGWAIGTESDFSWTNKRGSANDTGPGGVPTFVSTTKEHWLSTTRARIGPTWDRTWLYVTGGFALASVEADLNTNIPGFPLFAERRTQHGWTVGAGIEQSLGNNWSVKGEYLYVKLDNKQFLFGNNPLIVGLNAQRAAVNLDDHVFRVGFNYKFIDCLLICGGAPVAAKY